LVKDKTKVFKSLSMLLTSWREKERYKMIDSVSSLEKFTRLLQTIFSENVYEDDVYVEEIYKALFTHMIESIIFYGLIEKVLDDKDYFVNDAEDIYIELAEENEYVAEEQVAVLEELDDILLFFNSDNSMIIKSGKFKRVLEYLYVDKDIRDDESMLKSVKRIFRNVDRSELETAIEEFIKEKEEGTAEECEYDEDYIVSLIFKGLKEGEIEVRELSVDVQVVKDFLKLHDELDACLPEQIDEAIGLFSSLIKIQSVNEFLLVKSQILRIFKNISYEFEDVNELYELLKLIEVFLPNLRKKDVYRVAIMINQAMSLGINEKYTIDLDQDGSLSANINVVYDQILRKVYFDLLEQGCVKSENNILYFSEQPPSSSHIVSDEAGMFSIYQVHKFLKTRDVVHSYNSDLQEIRLTESYTNLENFTNYSQLKSEQKQLYEYFGWCIISKLYEARLFSRFPNIVQSMYISNRENETYTFDMFGGKVTFNIRKVLFLPTSWYPVACNLLTPGATDLNEGEENMIKHNIASMRVGMFNNEGAVIESLRRYVSFKVNGENMRENNDDNTLLILAQGRKPVSQIMKNIEPSSLKYFFSSMAFEHIPTAYLKYLLEGIIFYPQVMETLITNYSFTGVCHGLYKRFRNFFEQYYCNTINSENLFSPLLSYCFTDMSKQYALQTQWMKKGITNADRKCVDDYRYPACLSQIKYLLSNRAERELGELTTKIVRGIKTTELQIILDNSRDDLEFYNQLFLVNKELSKREKDISILEINKIRGKNRVKELRSVLSHLRRQVNMSFKYLDYGGSDGTITATISSELNLQKYQAFSVDVETWFGSEYPQPYKNEITYKIIKPNSPLDIENESLDVITCFQVLHHVQDLDYTVRDLVRKLKKGGMFIIREHDCYNSVIRVLIDVEHSLYEVVKKDTDKLNAGYLFETKDSDKYKSIIGWTTYLKQHGLELMEEFKKLHSEKPFGVTKYAYRVYKKM